MSRDVVQAQDLTRRFGDFVAVDRVSFQVSRGEIFGFLGSNGAGKSTTIRMLCGILQPSSGSAEVAGFDVYREAEEIRRNIGYMSQKFSLYDELSVEENIDFFSGVYAVSGERREARKEEVLERMGLQGERDATTGILPGGWKQRLALGCAILHEPPILFLDEPTSGVDPVARREFWDLIYELAEDGRTVFVTTHYMDEAEYCHRIALMHAGKILALDTPAELKKGLARDHFLQLKTNDLLGTLRTLEGEEELRDVAIFGGGIRIRIRDVEPARELIRGKLEEKEIELRSLELVEPEMEDVFVIRIEEDEEA